MSDEQLIDRLNELGRAEASLDARDFFDRERKRLETFSVDACGLHFDFSKHAVSSMALETLIDFAKHKNIAGSFEAMARGECVNVTEKRAAQHMALRGGGTDDTRIELAEAELARAFAFAEGVRSGKLKAANGESFTHILHIGIGGSDLGPRLVYDALRSEDDPVEVRFLSSLDPFAFSRAVEGLNPERTLVFIVSKSFTTPETSLNARIVMEWLESGIQSGIGHHLAAATASPEKAAALGLLDDYVFEMWDWVGGRYSLWSAVSTSVTAAIGSEKFRQLLSGAFEMDRHVLSAPFERNAPVLSALLAWWHRVIRQQLSTTVVPYSIRLRLFTSWLQQLSMESLGKGRALEGGAEVAVSGHVVWGGEGPDGQHAFFQFLHQGGESIPIDLIAFAAGGRSDLQTPLFLNAVAQAEALLVGRTEAEARKELRDKGMPDNEAARLSPHMVMPGGRSSTFILGKSMSAESLGALLAFYEHQTFALSCLYGVNAFDQFGVELGKKLAHSLEMEWEAGASGQHDVSTASLIQRARKTIAGEGDSGA